MLLMLDFPEPLFPMSRTFFFLGFLTSFLTSLCAVLCPAGKDAGTSNSDMAHLLARLGINRSVARVKGKGKIFVVIGGSRCVVLTIDADSSAFLSPASSPS